MIEQVFHATQRVRNPFDGGQRGGISIRELAGKKELIVVHVASEWQHAAILTKALRVTLFQRRRKALLNLPAEK